MSEATIALTVMTGLILAIFTGFLIWGIRSGQFRRVEEAKYRMLDGGGGNRADREKGEEP